MTAQQSSDDDDVFNLAQPARAEVGMPADVLAADSDDAGERAHAGASPLRDKIVKSCIGVCVLVGVCWILFPEWFSSPSGVVTSAVQQPNSLLPQQAIQADSYSSVAESTDSEAVGEPNDVLAEPAEIGSQGMAAPFQQQSKPSAEVEQALADPGNAKLVDAINGLNANQQELARRLVSLDERVAAVGKQISVKQLSAGRIESRRSAEPTLKPTLYRDYRAGAAKVARGIPGYEVNSIYRGMAWVRVGDRVHVVRPGDQLQDLTITSIDVLSRTVRTNRGDIR